MEKALEIFMDELLTFENKGSGVYDFTREVLQFLPEAFWKCGDNEKISSVAAHTKLSLEYANVLLKLEHVQRVFNELDRDMIRSALLLHDGFLYADGGEHRRQPEHPYIMSLYIMNAYWEKFLPTYIRADIASMVETHSGQWNSAGSAVWRKPERKNECFVHECVYLASKKGSIPVSQVSGIQAGNVPLKGTGPALDFNAALEIVKQMVNGRKWDGSVYHDGSDCYTYIDGQKVPVAERLEAAFVTAGQARYAKVASRGTYRDTSYSAQNMSTPPT